jgi:hypothetical protein
VRAVKIARSISVLMLLTSLACGGEPEPETTPETAAVTSGDEPRPRAAMQVQGTLGTIPERKILATLEPKLPKFQRCFFDGSAKNDLLGGEIKLFFRVDNDGRVTAVYPTSSTIGHLGTERCIVEEAQRARFPEPKGGDGAELSWGFALDTSAPRPPVEWDDDRVADVLAQSRESITACGEGRFRVTAYVAPGGRVISAGASAYDESSAAHLACVVAAVEAWQMPDPGSYAAKVSFDAP